MFKELKNSTYDEVMDNRIMIKLFKNGKVFLGSSFNSFDHNTPNFIFIDIFDNGNLLKDFKNKQNAINEMKKHADIYVFDDIVEALVSIIDIF